MILIQDRERWKMKLKQVRMYQPTKGWSTLCCDTKTEGRTCSVCGTIPEEKVYMAYSHLGYKDFTYTETNEQLTLTCSFSQVEITETHVLWKWDDEQTMAFTYDIATKTVELTQSIDQKNKYSPTSNVGTFHTVMNSFRRVRKGLMARFFSKCLQMSGVLYKKPKDFSHLEEVGWKHFQLLCEEPNLQHVPLAFFPTWTEKELASIRHMTKGKDIMTQITGHGTRAMIQWCTNQNKLDVAKLWGPHFQKPDNIMRILAQANEKNSSQIGDKQIKRFHNGMIFLSTFHKNETVLANRILSLIQKKSSITTAMGLIADLFFMYENIKHVEAEYLLPFEGDIERCHDWVSKDYKRLVEHPCVIFTYDDDQKKWEKDVHEYTFQLAKDSYELSRVGSDMRICVGSYSDRVETGESTIVWMKKPEAETVDVCLEINEQKRIVQAKTMRNELPDATLCKVIKDWAKKCELNIITQDIQVKEMQNV